MINKLSRAHFSDINHADLFFDLLRLDYPEFSEYFDRKSKQWCQALTLMGNGSICALSIIKSENTNRIFPNVSASKENWISGFFGINWFNISCVANYDSARVDLYLGNKSKEYNKKAYDKLLSHK